MAEKDRICIIEDVDVAIGNVVDENEDTYKDLMTRLSAKQKALLIALARSGKGAQPTSGEFVRKHHLTSASSVQRSLSTLQGKDIVTNSDGQYYIYDYFLFHWLNR